MRSLVQGGSHTTSTLASVTPSTERALSRTSIGKDCAAGQATEKARPAICLTEPLTPHRHIVLAFVTSRTPDDLLDTDVVLDPQEPGFAQTGTPALGLSIEEWLLYIAEQHVPSGSMAHLRKTDPAEWSRLFRAWADSHDPNTPVLSDEAMSRESIYSDRL